MGFQTPLYELSEYLDWTTSGRIQLPDFQRGYKWEDERIRSLLVSVLQGHPLGVVMLLDTGNNNVRFKPRPVEGVSLDGQVDADWLLLDGQQRLTSLTQALKGDGVVKTMDDRHKKLERKYYVDIAIAISDADRMDDAVKSLPADGKVTKNFGRDVVLDVSTPELERKHGLFPLHLLYSPEATDWLIELDNKQDFKDFNTKVLKPVGTYNIPAIELDKHASKAAVATVFEKVNTGGLPLNVFELLTATFAGDGSYYDEHGTDFRLNDDWKKTTEVFKDHPTLKLLESTDFLQAVTLLTTRERNLADTSSKPAGVSAKREDVLKLTLADYLKWVDQLRDAFIWAAEFLADLHIYDPKFVPYPKQLVPLAAIKVVMEGDADLLGPRKQLVRWYWSGILGELYGGAIETRFVRDLEQVPGWATDPENSAVPNTIRDAAFVESRLHSLKTRNAAAYKGIYALILANNARDWMEDKALDELPYRNLAVDIHHIFPKAWCKKNQIEDDRPESIVNKTAISARTNRTIGGAAPSRYLASIEEKAQIGSAQLDGLLEQHLIPAGTLRSDNFDAFFIERRERICLLIEGAMGKKVQRDVDEGDSIEGSDQFEAEEDDVNDEMAVDAL